MKKLAFILIGFLASCSSPEQSPPDMSRYPIIPVPSSITAQDGSFTVTPETPIVLRGSDSEALERLLEYLREITGWQLPVTTEVNEGAIALSIESGGSNEGGESVYSLRVSGSGISITAGEPAGLFYGIQTLRQLIPLDGTPEIPAVSISDSPRFGYRGMQLDVGRHFFPVSFIKKYIDMLAMYKMNTFHWHLTEDQGWRIEIKKYPRLTEIGAFRKETILEKNFDPYIGDGEPHGGFYTQDEVREIVAYAAERYITVIPEIEMPGHSTAALAAYPELACSPGPYEVSTVWGVKYDIYCPSEETFTFLEDVLTEVMDLFPSEYIHIGGDEAPKRAWEESALAQEVIAREGLQDEHELQSYFIRRIEKFLLANGRRLIGWDEILEGGLAPEATVMSWRGMDGGIAAARQGNDVIMTPTSHCYFDYYQGDPATEPLAIGGLLSLEQVYDSEPIPEALTPEEATHILGAQGNVWTEYMKTEDYVEYMVFPRMLALAEVVWSPKTSRDWDSFTDRLGPHLKRLESMDVNFRVPTVNELESDRLTLKNEETISLSSPLSDVEIRYTLDGSEPTKASERYSEPFAIQVDSVGTVVSARVFMPGGTASPVKKSRIQYSQLEEPATVNENLLESGIQYRYFEKEVDSVFELEDGPVARTGVLPEPGFPENMVEEFAGLIFDGLVNIPRDDIYTFALTSDDGSAMLINGRLVIDNDGHHGPMERKGTAALAAGFHKVRILFFQGFGGKILTLTMSSSDSPEPVAIPGRMWFHEPNLAHAN